MPKLLWGLGTDNDLRKRKEASRVDCSARAAMSQTEAGRKPQQLKEIERCHGEREQGEALGIQGTKEQAEGPASIFKACRGTKIFFFFFCCVLSGFLKLRIFIPSCLIKTISEVKIFFFSE